MTFWNIKKKFLPQRATKLIVDVHTYLWPKKIVGWLVQTKIQSSKGDVTWDIGWMRREWVSPSLCVNFFLQIEKQSNYIRAPSLSYKSFIVPQPQLCYLETEKMWRFSTRRVFIVHYTLEFIISVLNACSFASIQL